MSDDGVIVLGGGLAGLSTAFHFGRRCQVFEAEDVAGGLLRTREKEGYLFDYTGHLLHVRDRYAEDFIKGLLKGNLVRHTRRAAVFSKGTYTRYPFQANAYGLPEDVASECVGGFEKARREIGEKRPGSFGEWITANFGEGIARHFMLPYNRKLWRYPLEDMAVEGVEPFVPVPTVEDARRGATEEGATGLGYNASFYYPERGGIYSLVEAMLPHVRDLSLGQRAIEVDPERKTVSFSTGYTAWYGSLVSTMPLPELVGIIKDVPADIAEAARRLRYVSVYDVSLGIKKPDLTPWHWIYFPEPEFAFYRLGSMSSFSASAAPEGCTSVYAEISHLPGETMPDDEAIARTLDGMRMCGLLGTDDVPEVADAQDIKYAYAVFDAHSKRAVPAITDFLSSKGIMSIGRYGAWEYSSMEGAILEGKRAAERLR